MLLRTKILMGYGIALGLMALAMGWAVVHLVRLGRASDAILRENYRSIQAAQNMSDALEQQDKATLLMLQGEKANGERLEIENQKRFLEWLGLAKNNITVEGEADIVRSIDTRYADYLANLRKLSELRDAASMRRFREETLQPIYRDVREGCARLREINQETMIAASARAERVAQTALWSTVSVGAAAVAAGLWFSLLLSKRLVRPIHEMMAATGALAEGHYDAAVPVGRTDELGRLAEDFNAMAKKLGAYHRLNVEKIVAEKRKGDAVLRSIEDGIVVVDSEFRITDANPPAARVLAVPPAKAVGMRFLDAVKNEPLFEHIRTAAETGKAPAIEEGKNILTVGEGDAVRHYLYAVTPVVSEGGGMLGVVLLLRDVTRLKELERLKSEFMMAASHELKTPLQSLGMSIELLQEGAAAKLTEKERQLLTAAHEEVERLKALVGDLLDLSRIEAGTVQMEIARTPAAMLLEQAVGVFRRQAEAQRVELSATAAPDVPDVRADAGKIAWVLTNLISNALRYVSEGGWVRLSAGRVGEWVHLSVADNGEGIPEEYQSHIFDKFTKAKSRRSVGGSGLGLAISREIVRAHKGAIWVESAPGKGSIFTFTLPVWNAEGARP